MFKLHLTSIFAIIFSISILSGCNRPHGGRPIDPLFPWPSSGVAEADSLTLRLERNVAFGEPYSGFVEMIDSFAVIAKNNPDNHIVDRRYKYFLAWNYTGVGDDKKWLHIYDSVVSQIDSAKESYEFYKWRQLKAHGIHDQFAAYELSSDNLNYFDRIGDEYEKCRDLIIIGNMHSTIKDTVSAMQNYEEALELSERHGWNNIVWASKINIMPYVDSLRSDTILKSLLKDDMVRRAPLREAMTLERLYLNSGDISYIDKAIINQESFAYPGILPLLYYHKGERMLNENSQDSATFYFRLCNAAMSKGYEGPDSVIFEFRMAEAYEYEGKIDSAYVQMSKAFQSMNNTIAKLRYSDVSETELKRNIQLAIKNKELEKMKTLAAVTIMALLVVGSCVAVIISYRKKMIEKKLKAELYAEQLRHAQELNELRTLVLSEKESFISEITEVIETTGQQLNDDPVINRLSKAVQIHKSSESDRNTMITTKEGVKPGIERALREDFPELTSGQVKLALMIIAGVDNRQIGRALNISAESVWKNRYRLRSRLGLDKSVNLDDFLRNYSYSHN